MEVFSFLLLYLFICFRADASSRFAEGHRWGYFPSFSGAWRISEESFMANTKSWLSNLKIRASYGLLGNQDALSDYYPALNTYDIGYNYPFGGALNTGYAQSSYKLSTITWEKSTTWGVGLDFGFLNNKITGSLDFYDRKTTGILMQVSVPTEFALNPYVDNVGSMDNRGVELNIIVLSFFMRGCLLSPFSLIVRSFDQDSFGHLAKFHSVVWPSFIRSFGQISTLLQSFFQIHLFRSASVAPICNIYKRYMSL